MIEKSYEQSQEFETDMYQEVKNLKNEVLNEIETIPPEVKSKIDACDGKTLDLSDMDSINDGNIEEIINEIAKQHPDLYELDLSGNKLETIPGIGQLKKLGVLHITDCDLSKLDLTGTQVLFLSPSGNSNLFVKGNLTFGSIRTEENKTEENKTEENKTEEIVEDKTEEISIPEEVESGPKEYDIAGPLYGKKKIVEKDGKYYMDDEELVFEKDKVVIVVDKKLYEITKNETEDGLSFESVEKEKSLIFEEENFKIDSEGWNIETRKSNFGTYIKVKVSPAGDVIEYLDGPAKGEQLFIGYDNFIKYLCIAKNCTKEEAENRYLMTIEEFNTKMKDKPSSSKASKTFYTNEIAGHIAWYWDSNFQQLDTIVSLYDIRLVGGADARFLGGARYIGTGCSDFGFSGRLLKN